MAQPPSKVHAANERSLKRSFTAVTVSTPPSPERQKPIETRARKSSQHTQRSRTQAAQVKGLESKRSAKMPSAARPRFYENQIPSFAAVYDMDANSIDSPGVEAPTKISASSYLSQQRPFHTQPLAEHESEKSQIHSHQHRESTSTQASDSTDSSPTTTISTVDSSSLSDPSPSSSPESPINLVPLSSFSGSTFGLESFQSLKMVDTTPIRSPLSDERPMTSPSPRKAKNPKSLALNLNPSAESFRTSEPSSPSFIKPPTLTGRKKPSLLSLNTGAANKLSLNVEPIGSPGVPTMLHRRGLKHSISSPQMLSTPGFGPAGGMTLGDRSLPRSLGASRLKESNLSMDTFTITEDTDQEPGVQMATRVPGASVGGDSFDRSHSGEDAKSPSYPDGPILMHEPSVHLYLEPKMEEAMKFDVVINVAREVKNPFKDMTFQGEQKDATSSSISDTSSKANPRDTTPDTAASMMSFQTAFEVQPSSSTESSPTTPKAAPEKKLPEYIHVPWDHNTDVKDELWDLCQTIESRVKEGKRVLVHCQQGASRSATLIIAYGMYLNQDLGPNEAYTLAQSKSRWINPNMSLLFSLSDFKKVIEQKKAEKANAVKKPSTKHRPTMSADPLDPPPTPSRARGNSTPSVSARDNALNKPEEAKQSSPIPETTISETTIRRFADFDFGFGDASSSNQRSIPVPQRPAPEPPLHHIERSGGLQEDDDWNALMSPRITEMTSNPLHDIFPRSRSSEPQPQVSPTPALLSPRIFEFPRSSFFPIPSVVRNSLAVDEDPRSPPTKGEAPITRFIDDFL
jgi:tyrosine-protein phosphatase